MSVGPNLLLGYINFKPASKLQLFRYLKIPPNFFLL